MMRAILPTSDLTHDAGYPALKEYIIHTTGLAYYSDKDEDFSNRILRRLSKATDSTGRIADDCFSYLNLLQTPSIGEAELDALIEQLTIGETSFFRHGELFDGLRETVLPDIIARNRDRRRLRVWSAGCSIGAEPYSISILLQREFKDQIAGWDVSILGTDINRQFLARGRAGLFKSWDFRNAPPWIVDECFTRRGDELAILPEYQRHVSFQYHNLVRHSFPALMHNLVAFDLILCRNVIIYFASPITGRLIDHFQTCLVDGGWLLVGHSEPNNEAFREFRTVNVPGAILYQKPEATNSSGKLTSDGAWPTGSVCAERIASAPPPKLPAPLYIPSGRTRELKTSRSAKLEAVHRLADAGCLEDAARRCTALVREEPLNPVFHFYLAMLMEQMELHHPAEASLRTALRIDGRFVLARYFLALVQQKRGHHMAAHGAYEEVLGLLGGMSDSTGVPEADGMSVGILRELTRTQMEIVSRS